MNQPSRPAPIPVSALGDPVLLLASGFGSGCAPLAPGTAGSLVGVLFYIGLAGLALPLYLGAVLALALAGVWLCGRAGRTLGVSDHPGIVWDEIVGLLVTMTATPPSWQGVALGFVLFRAFDIAKPWPVSALERRVAGGLGVMLDDVAAGLLALASLQILRHSFGIP